MTLNTKFSDFAFSDVIDRALKDQGYTQPTPIQAQTIPPGQQGRDIQGIAQTGTGKTAAFALPILDRLARDPKDPPKRSCRVLVLAPTRELASQIAVSFDTYGKYLEPVVSAIYGGVSIQKQIKRVTGGNDVIVATPGRLIDLIDQKLLHLSDVEVLVLDEADQMMDMGFIHALRKIAGLVPKQRQTLFFSATMPGAIAKLAAQFLTNPIKVSVTPQSTTAERVTQTLTFVNQAEKQALLTLTLADPDIDRALIFTRTKHGADRVVKSLWRAGLDSVAIHGNKSQAQRQRALDAFREGRVRFLIATDIAARGIDIEGITHVINYEIPNVPEQYVHRIGRTARAGREGRAIAFVAKDERDYLKSIEKQIGQTIDVLPLPENFMAEVNRLKALPAVDMPQPSQADAPEQPRGKRGKNRRQKGQTSAAKGRGWQADPNAPALPETGFSPDGPISAGGSGRPKSAGRGGRGNMGPRAERASRPPRDVGSERSGPPASTQPVPQKPKQDGEYRRRVTAPSPAPANQPHVQARPPRGESEKDAPGKFTRRPREDKPRSDSARSDKPRSDSARSDKPRSNGARSDKPRSDVSRSDKPRSPHSRGGRPSAGGPRGSAPPKRRS